MGIWQDVFVAPAQPTWLDRAAFADFMLAFGRRRVVRPPWFLLGGELDVNRLPRWVHTVLARTQENPGAVVTSEEWGDSVPFGDPVPAVQRAALLATGDDILGLVRALATAPYGEVDLAVVFSRLEFDNPVIRRHFWFVDPRIVLVAFALKADQARIGTSTMVFLGDNSGIPEPHLAPTHPVRTLVTYVHKHGDEDPCPAVRDVVRAHLGENLISGCLYF